MSTPNPTPTQQGETLDELCPWCRQRPQRYMVPANSPHDPCGGIVPRVRCITYQCPLNCFEMTPKDWNTRRAAVAGPRGDALLEIIKQVTKKHHESRTHPPTYCCPEDEPFYDRQLAKMLVEAIAAATASPAPAEPTTEDMKAACDSAVASLNRDGKWTAGDIGNYTAAFFSGWYARSNFNAAPAERTRVAGEQEKK